MFNPGRANTIFVQIAAYRDPELYPTIVSCLMNATHPENISFGVMHQYDKRTLHILDPFRGESGFGLAECHWSMARGAGVARNISETFYRGEEFSLQIDSHMYFDKGWDDLLIKQWRSCNDPKAVLSVYPPSYVYDNKGQVRLSKTDNIAQMYVGEFFNKDIPVFRARELKRTDKDVQRLRRSAFVCGGFVFSAGSILKLPYIKEICFMGDEIARSVQLFTHGYNFYVPRDLPIYHMYGRRDTPKYWDDMQVTPWLQKTYREMTNLSYRTIRNMLQGKSRRYVGRERTLREYEAYAGVDFRRLIISEQQQKKIEPPYENDLNWSSSVH